tara:strand:+ start:93 stop:1211 length:1119 start_codon:yes stop_codon:yes gene_type:complete
MKKIYILIFSLSIVFSADYVFLKTYSNITNVEVLDQNDLESIDILFEEELSSYVEGGLIDFGSVINLSKSCPDNQCAIEELNKTNSQFIVYTRIIKLGNKLRYSGTILSKEGVVFNTKLIVMNASEMEEGVMRLVKSVALRESIDDVADIDNIVPSESVESDRIKSFYKTGVSIGYIYPLGSSYTYRKTQSSSWPDDDEMIESNQSQKIKISAMYMYDFKENESLLIEALGYFGEPTSFGVNASYLKYQNKENFSPYIGGGIGLQWVPYCSGYDCENDFNKPEDHRRSGISLSAQAGYMMFRTYDINVMTRLQYHLVLNSDFDQGIVVDVGLLKKPKPRAESSRSTLQNVASGIGNMYLFLIAVSLLGAIAS